MTREISNIKNQVIDVSGIGEYTKEQDDEESSEEGQGFLFGKGFERNQQENFVSFNYLPKVQGVWHDALAKDERLASENNKVDKSRDEGLYELIEKDLNQNNVLNDSYDFDIDGHEEVGGIYREDDNTRSEENKEEVVKVINPKGIFVFALSLI